MKKLMEETLPKILTYLEEMVKKNKSGFIVGQSVSCFTVRNWIHYHYPVRLIHYTFNLIYYPVNLYTILLTWYTILL